ncbi:MAG: glycosyltransferase family 39 protein [Planctomycetia bacterium]|nr:glycosyltransferase family 39 protein [Planctomycetia bacterium]
MFRRFDRLTGHIAAIVIIWALVCLPSLGVPSLWDIDEGNNFECVREMIEADNWVVPTFNYSLRTDKPALLYWLQIAAASVIGLNEWAARLPSAFSVLVVLLTVYALGRQMFGPLCGLLAALVLATSPGVAGAARFANPDALLLACTTLTLTLFWNDYASRGRGWLVGVGMCAGLGVLAKGPVGFVLPAAIAFLFLVSQGEWKRLLNLRVLGLILACVLVAAPWYGWVAAETRGVWIREFWNVHNLGRATRVMENHSGPIFYYLLVLVPALIPWSIFLGPVCYRAWSERREPAVMFLVIWALLYLVFFSLARTKLPNYVLPAYPALALLTGRYLERWIAGESLVPAWLERVGLVGLALVGFVVSVGLLVLGGLIPLTALRARTIPGVHLWAGLGLVLVAGAGAAAWCLDRGRRDGAMTAITLAGAIFLMLAGAFVAPVVDEAKAPRPLAGALPAELARQDARIATWDYFQPSLVFYCRREVVRLNSVESLVHHLDQGNPAFAFLPESQLPQLEQRRPVSVLARHKDLYLGRTIVLVANRLAGG